LASLVSAAVGALIEFDEVDVRMLDENTVEYKILTTGMMPEAIELKTLIWSYLSPPVKSCEVMDIEVVERGFITNRYLVTVRGEVKGLPMSRGKGPIRRWRRRIGRLIPEEPEG